VVLQPRSNQNSNWGQKAPPPSWLASPKDSKCGVRGMMSPKGVSQGEGSEETKSKRNWRVAQVGLSRQKVEREAHKNWACSRRMREWTQYKRARGSTQNREAPRNANGTLSRRRT